MLGDRSGRGPGPEGHWSPAGGAAQGPDEVLSRLPGGGGREGEPGKGGLQGEGVEGIGGGEWGGPLKLPHPWGEGPTIFGVLKSLGHVEEIPPFLGSSNISSSTWRRSHHL